MSGIGISPCPPFQHRAGLPPGVLWDGNTAAWYKYNDPVAGCIYDGANRTSKWLDKYNYALGAEMMPATAVWAAPGGAWWNGAFPANWTGNGVLLHSDGNNGTATRNAFWTAGLLYKITVTIILNAGSFYPPFSIGFVQDILIASQTFTYYYTPINNNMNILSALFLGDVTAISIRRIAGNHLIQNTGANQPLWSAANGVLFDSANDFMAATAFAFVQPEFIYFVGRQVTWGGNDYIFDGNTINGGSAIQWAVSPELLINSGANSPSNNNLILNTFGILRVLFNGLNSRFQINNTLVWIGGIGLNNMNGFYLGTLGTGVGLWSNIEVKEIILRRSADNAATQTSIYNYLKTANAVP